MTKRKLISLTERMEEMVNEIMDARGYPSFSGVIHSAIAEMHSKTFPAYKGVSSRNEDAGQKVRRKKAEKDAKLEMLRQEKLLIIEELSGKLIEENNVEYCSYYTYSSKKRFSQKVTLHLLTSQLIKAQYSPSKEHVLKLQKEKKVDYK